MAVTYCTVDGVKRTFARNAIQVDSHTRLSTTDFETFINRAEEQIDRYINKTYRSQVDQFGHDGEGILLDIIYTGWSYSLNDYVASAKVPYGPIQSIVRLEVFRGGNGYEDRSADVNNANRPNGIWFNPNGKEIYFGRNIPLPYTTKNAIRIKYRAGIGSGGFTTVPGHIAQACELMTAAIIVQSDRWSHELPGSSDHIPLSVKAQQWLAMAYGYLEQERGFVWS